MIDHQTLILLKRIVALSHSTDPLLEALVTVCSEQSSFSVSIGLGLTVSGVVHRGWLDTPGPFAERIDETLLLPFEKVSTVEGSPNQELLDALTEVFRGKQLSANVDESRQRSHETLTRLQERFPDGIKPGDVEKLPDDLVNDAIAYLDRQSFVQLKDAEIFRGGTWTPVGLVRISVSHVGSWWLLDEQWNR
jgi:hypothetical protein